MARRPGPPVGAGIVGVGVGLGVAALVLAILDRNSPPDYRLAGLSLGWSWAVRTAVQTIGLLTLSLVSGLLLWRQPRSLLSWVAGGVVVALAGRVFASEYAVHGLLVDPGSLPLADAAAWLQVPATYIVLLGAFVAIMLFPDGRLLSARWRPAVAACAAVLAGFVLASLYDPYPQWVGLFASQPVPITMPTSLWPVGALLSGTGGALNWSLPALAILIALYVIRRLIKARGETRLQLKWFAYAAVIYCLTSLLALADSPPPLDFLPDFIRQPWLVFAGSGAAHAIASWANLGTGISGLVLIPLAVGIAIVRYRLYDIDVVISRTILFGGLAAFVAATYGIVVGGVGSLLGQQAGLSPVLTLFAIAIAAALLEPVRARLQRLANVLVYGKRATPYEVLSDFARTLSGAEPSEVLLPRLAELLRAGTGVAGVEVWVRVGDQFQLAAASPAATTGPRLAVHGVGELRARVGAAGAVAPVFHEAEQLGALAVVQPRGEQLNVTERRLLDDLASQAGLLFSRFRLVEELRRSRSRIVAAEDLERKRIERNLHDGAQQQLVSLLLSMQIAKAEALRSSDRSVADLIDANIASLKAALDELRELARGIHPTILTQAGLMPALQSLAERCPIPVEISGELGGVRLAPTVEAALYFVAAEAITNAVKHSKGGRMSVSVGRNSRLATIEVSDDGMGGADLSRGSGLLGLTDRVAAVGGRLVVESNQGTGTKIRAEVPCG